MGNHIQEIQIEDRSLDPVNVDLRISIRPERMNATTELRGKFMGPSCPYANTIEIAYPLLPPKRGETSETGRLTARVVIPEASLWDPQSPFLYNGVLELWEDGERCERKTLRHALRKIHLGPNGVRINSKAIRLEGRRTDRLDESLAKAWRQEGVNLLLVPLREDTLAVWEAAEQLGFLVLGRVERREEIVKWTGTASHLGFVWGETVLESDVGLRGEPNGLGYQFLWRDHECGRVKV